MSDTRSLQDVIDSQSDFLDYLRNRPTSTHNRMSPGLSPVQPEYSNWRNEQRAWNETVALFDQSHHMPIVFLSGPDALALLTKVGVNSLANLRPGIAKQFIACNSRGQIIGECVLHDLGDRYELISGQPILNWVEYQAEIGGYDVTIEKDPASWDHPEGPSGRTEFRYQIDGPNAWDLFNEVVEGPVPDLKFFHTAKLQIAGVEVLVLRHGMAGHRGFEISGAYADGEKVRSRLLEAGEKHGIVRGGAKAYYSSVIESGWISYPLPAIYTGEDEAGYRQWLPETSWEARFQLGGSYVPDDIEDLYVTPYDLSLKMVRFDHDFIGREALERLAEAPPRVKVALEWNSEDVLRVIGSQLVDGPLYKTIEFPTSDYAQIHRDAVSTPDGTFIGVSTHGGYTVNDRAVTSYAFIDQEFANIGDEVVVTWGEPGGGTLKGTVERPHEQTTIRAIICPAPYSSRVREMKYAPTLAR